MSESPAVSLVQSPQIKSLESLPSAGQPSSLFVGTKLKDLRSLIVPEMHGFLELPGFALEASAGMSYDLSYGAEWNINSSASQAEKLNSQQILAGLKAKAGLLFGNQGVLSHELDEDQRAKKILWNLAAVFARQGSLDYNFQLLLINNDKLQRAQSGRLNRVYPAILSDSSNLQLFRETIKILSPAVLNGLNWLTFRFVGDDEDLEWLYSPAIKSIRQLTAANRADPILRYDFSAEDFFGWSGKLEAYAVQVDREITALVPFNKDRLSALTSGGCRTVDIASAEKVHAAPQWNYASQRFANGPAWLPTNTTFVPRPLWGIELAPNNPFVNHGRQVLYVDRELFLPYYKFVYDRSGRLIKSVVSSFGLLEGISGNSQPVNMFVLSYSHARKEATVVQTNRVAVCSEQVAGSQISDFDPSRIGPLRTEHESTMAKTSTEEEVDEL